MAILVSKVAPALAGAYVRNLFPPRRAIGQVAAEALGGVILVVYAGHVAAGGLWALLGWALGMIGRDPQGLMDRGQSDMLAAFLVGLLGMELVKGALIWVRLWRRG